MMSGGGTPQCDLSHDSCDVTYLTPVDRQTPVKHYLPAFAGGNNLLTSRKDCSQKCSFILVAGELDIIIINRSAYQQCVAHPVL